MKKRSISIVISKWITKNSKTSNFSQNVVVSINKRGIKYHRSNNLTKINKEEKILEDENLTFQEKLKWGKKGKTIFSEEGKKASIEQIK